MNTAQIAHALEQDPVMRKMFCGTAQIAHALEQDPVMSKMFCGMFPSNKLPETIIKYPCEFVANTDPSDKPGTQWVAFYIPTEQKGKFFDSYGQPPSFYRDSFGNTLNKHSCEWKFNTRKLQSTWSDVCGQYCIFYLRYRARGGMAWVKLHGYLMTILC